MLRRSSSAGAAAESDQDRRAHGRGRRPRRRAATTTPRSASGWSSPTPAWRAPRPRSAAASSMPGAWSATPISRSKWLTLAAKAGDPLGPAPARRLLFQRRGRHARPRHRRGVVRARRQAGRAHAQDMLSWILTDGDHRKPDYKQAMRLGAEGRRAGHGRLHDPPRPALQQRAGRRARRRLPPRSGGARPPPSTMPTARPCWAPRTTSAPACRAIRSPRSPG